MLVLSAEQRQDLARAVEAAHAVEGLPAAVGDIYRRVQAAVDERRPACSISGRCCRFEEFGHRLFVTTAELAVFARQVAVADRPAAASSWDGSGCPFQFGGLCGVHIIRPFGCRIYFCDPTSTAWQQGQYEQSHAELRALHERLGIPYFYVEWREGLRAAGLVQT
jgi:Fe-S-cluster containining protein